VDRTGREAERSRRPLRTRLKRVVGVRPQTGRRDVDGLLEVRPVEGVGLVEERQHPQLPVDEKPLERVLTARHEFFHEYQARRFAAGQDVGRRKDAPQSLEGRHELRRRVGADHPSTGGQAKRFDHTGIGHSLGKGAWVLIHPMQRESWHRHLGSSEARPLLELVPSRLRGGYRVSVQADGLGNRRGDHRGVVIDAHHARDRVHPHELTGLFGRSLGMGEIESNEAGRVRRLERTRPLGCDGQLHAQSARGLHERGGAVGRRREEQQEPRHAAPYFLAAAK